MHASALPPLRLLSVFDVVLRLGSLQKAADELNVTQPAISQALKSLESFVGARLIDRRTRPVSATEAGRVLQTAVAEGFSGIAEAIERARLLHRQEEAAVTIACSVGVATYWLMPRLTDWHAAHPDIAVHVLTSPQGAPSLGGGVDLAIRYGLGDWKDGKVTKLFEEAVAPVCSPALADRLGGLGLAQAPLLHVKTDDASWLGWKRYFELKHLRESQAPGRIFTNYVQATQAALAGQGVMLGWRSITGALVREGRLVALVDPPLVPDEAFYLVASPRDERRTARETLAHWLLSTARADQDEPARL